MISDFSDMLTETITVYTRTGADSYGKPIFGGGVSYSCRIQWRNTLVRDARGEEVVASGNALLQGAPALSSDDKVTLPDGSEPLILTVTRAFDEEGAHHSRVYF